MSADHGASLDRRNVLLGGSTMVAASVFATVGEISGANAQSAASKPPSEFTRAANRRVLEALPFNDRTDFENAQRGFVAGVPDDTLKDANGKAVFDLKPLRVPTSGPAPDTMNPSLWRISQLNSFAGLFKVTDRIYQARNMDVANVTFIEGDTGVIVMDPAIATTAARAALDLYFSYRPRKPVTAVIFTHSHADHFGGVAAVTSVEDVASGKTRIVAPAGFTEEAVSENLYAGNAMFRRALYMGGGELPRGAGPGQTLGSGLGISGATDPLTLIKPTDFITKTGQKMTIDGLEFEFLMAPGSEAPSEMHFYIPVLKALCTAENACHTLHNFYTLRGAKTRDSSKWVRYLNETLETWGDQAEVLYAPHHWPVWGNENIRRHIENYRDAFKFIHDRSLHLANAGYTMPEIGELVKLPPELDRNWATRGYYGTVSHDARAVYNFYLGYFSENPAELEPLPPVQAAPRYVELMGGAAALLAKAQAAYDAGDYRWAAQILQHLVLAQPEHEAARYLQADAFEQLGYQAEAATWRNIYFAGAQELRRGIPKVDVGFSNSPDLAKAIPLEMAIDFLGIQLDSEKAAGKMLTINFDVEDTGEKRSLTLRNRVLNQFSVSSPSPDATIKGSNASIVAVLMEGKPAEMMSRGDVKTDGRAAAVTELIEMTTAPEFWFPIVTRPAWKG
ncbi:MBL fold metallo-hydrolase [Bradyrhizobium elkanii]|uniref:Linear primary-alkylsulfatase n=1 Tax=Bradyrhizobium elkanii TaxID=29448 RepID=A0A4U6S3D3_BRAEL|nr:alkyl sulfatase dimerization domain-containing protein [Bradyrhizobium elkanii]TKV82237.1 MBL fold metallo-hydrolase [Bradyrhizobium elkanii]